MKLVNFLLIAIAAVAVSAGTAFASINISGGNNTTGCESENENNWCIESGNRVTIENNSDANNDFEVCANAGSDEFECNTCLGDVMTGDVLGSVRFENILNDSDLVLAPMDLGDINIILANSLTGPNSENENNVQINNENRLTVRNDADIDNNIDFSAITGRNSISHNTCVGDVSTGDVAFSVDVRNEANRGMDWDAADLIPASDISISAGNTTTGPCSENENNISVDNSSRVTIENNADINNDVNIHANTGNNTIGCNTCVGNVSTGSISISYTAINAAN